MKVIDLFKAPPQGPEKGAVMPWEEVAAEVALMRSFDHTHIVRMLGFYEGRQFLKVVMELVEGGALFDATKDERVNVSLQDVAVITSQLTDALAYMHGMHVVHRDVKGDNVMLAHPPVGGVMPDVKLIDFGLATLIKEGGFCCKTDRQLRQLCGTPPYMAPEIWANWTSAPTSWAFTYGRTYGTKVDVYALGVTIYMLLLGTFPFRGNSLGQVAHAACGGESAPNFEPVRGRPAYCLPDPAVKFLKKALKPKQSSRPSAIKASGDNWLTGRSRALVGLAESEIPIEVRQDAAAELRVLGAMRLDDDIRVSDPQAVREREEEFFTERREACERLEEDSD